MMSTGVNVTASCLSEKMVPRINAYPEEALYIKNSITTKYIFKYKKILKLFKLNTYKMMETYTKIEC